LTTSPQTKIKILSEVWMKYRDDDAFEEFTEYNDIGLPLSYFIDSEIVEPSPRADLYISETFDMLLASLELEDKGFESFDDMLDSSSNHEVDRSEE
jgi:hypothetical protein